jgi:hypothetical protein
MNPITITNQGIRVHADSKIEPFARWVRNRNIPKGLLAYWGQELLRNARGLAHLCESNRRILPEVAIVMLFLALDYTIVIQKGLSASAETGISATGTLSSE